MSTVSVLYTRRRHPGSLFIRSWMHSPFSHCALIDPARGEVIEAVLHEGVRSYPLDRAIAESSHRAIETLPCPYPERAIAAARSQIGKRYDWKANIGVGLRCDWHDAERWNCVELAAWAIAQGGRQLFHDERHHRLWPGLLYLPAWDRESLTPAFADA